MNYFWGNVFEYFKDRRLGSVFFGSLAVVMVLLVLVVAFFPILQLYWPAGLSAIGLLLLVRLWLALRQLRALRLNRYKSSPLSRDEMAKARSKLIASSNFKKL